MACPLLNTEENKKKWEEFVEKSGSEFQAYAMFFNNNYEIPNDQDIKVKEYSKEQTAEIKNFIKYTKTKDNIQFSLDKAINERSRSDDAITLDKMIDLSEKLGKASITESVHIMINNGISVADSILDKLENEELGPEDLTNISAYLGAFKNIKEIIEYVKQSEIEDKDKALQRLSNLVSKIERFNGVYLNKGEEAIIDILANESTHIRDRKALQFDIEFSKNNPRSKFNGTSKEYQEKKKKYIEESLAEQEEIIRVETKDYVREQLSVVQQDIGTVASWLDDPRGVNDHIIQLVVKILDKADFNTINRYTSSRIGLLKELEAYEKVVGKTTNQKEKYEGIIEKIDGKETHYIVGATYNHIMEEYKNLKRRYEDFLIPVDVKIKEINEFKDKYIDKKHHTKDLFKSIYVNDVNHPLYKYGKESIKNPQWKELQSNPAKLKMWKAIKEFNKESDKIARRGKLGYKLPSIRKSNFEFLRDEGITQYAKSSIQDMVKKNQNDIEEGATETLDGVTKVITDREGQPIKKVNLPYRGEINLEDQSYDLVGISLANRYVSINYQEKNNIKAITEITKDLLGDRKVKSTKGGQKLVTSIKNVSKKLIGEDLDEIRDIERKGIDSNSYKLLNSIIEDRVYGISNVDAGEIFGMDGNKLANNLMKWSGDVMLIGNYMGATSNVLQGKVMNFLEGVKNNHYDRKNLRNAESLYWGDISGIMGDIESVTPSSKTNLFIEKFLGHSVGFETLTTNIIKNNKALRLASKKTLHGLNSSAEHYVQGTVLYALMDSIEIDGKKLHELYTVEDGNLVIDFKYRDKVDEFEVSRKIKGIVATLHGNYDSKNKAMIQRYWFGKLAFFLRKWIVRTVKRRYDGLSTTDKTLEELIIKEPHRVRHAAETGEFVEGTYTSALRFLRLNFENIKTLQFQVMSKNWDTLSDMERKNIQSAVAEVVVMTLAWLSANLLLGLAEGDDDDFLYNVAYVNRRLYSELMFYVPVLNPMESLRVLSTPTATMSMLEQSARAMRQVTSDLAGLELEEYQTGRRKGKIKSIHMIRRMFDPFYKNIGDKKAKESINWLMGN